MPQIIYHANCMDGYTAAYVAFKELRWPSLPTLHPGVYAEPLPPVRKEQSVYVVDFSYPLEQMQALSQACALLIWLDHHKTAIEESGHLMNTGNIVGRLTTERSGAWLTWQWFHGSKEPPDIVKLVDDRDRWQFHDPRSRPFGVALAELPQTEESWDYAASHVPELVAQGTVMMAKRMQHLNAHLDQYIQAGHIGGHLVPVCELSYKSASDAGAEMLRRYGKAPFAATFFKREDGKYVYSLRSRQGEFDVGALAKQFGGGGHQAAAGFASDERIDLMQSVK